VPDNIDRIIAEELFAWAELILVLLERIIMMLGTLDLDYEQRHEFSRRARDIEVLFVDLGEIVEEKNEADMRLEELIIHLDRLQGLIMSTHEIIDELTEAEL
jgi:hypothetical protein